MRDFLFPFEDSQNLPENTQTGQITVLVLMHRLSPWKEKGIGSSHPHRGLHLTLQRPGCSAGAYGSSVLGADTALFFAIKLALTSMAEHERK